MLQINIPGYKTLNLQHLVMDYNGTLAVDGEVVPGVKEKLRELQSDLQIHIITADTFGKVQDSFAQEQCTIKILGQGNQVLAKLNYIQELGPEQCVCLGNGRNDCLMLQQAGLGIAVLLEEGISRECLQSAELFIPGILPALELLSSPLRLKATLRS